MEPPQQVLLAYGWDRLLRDILAAALSSYDWQVLGSLTKISGDVRLALVNCSRLTAAEAIEDVQRAGAQYPTAKIILLGSEITDPELLLLIEAGMSAYVDTREGLPKLLDAMKMVCEDRSPSAGRITRLVLENISERTRQRGTHVPPELTFREREVLRLITRGASVIRKSPIPWLSLLTPLRIMCTTYSKSLMSAADTRRQGWRFARLGKLAIHR